MSSLPRQQIVAVSPVYGGADRDHLRCKRDLENLHVTIIETENCPYIDMARSALVEMANELQPAWTVMVWLDHDILFQAEDVVKLAEHCHTSDYDVLAVLYSMRRPKFTTIGRPAKHIKTAEFYKPGLIDGDFCGMGFTAVKRHVFERLAATMQKLECPTVGRSIYPFFSHSTEKGAYLGEDISFCYRLQALGMKVGIDCEPRIYHRGGYDYALEDVGIAVPDHPTLVINFDPNPPSDITKPDTIITERAAE